MCRCGFTFGEVAKVVLWLLLTIVTAAVALLFYPYYLARFILQHTRTDGGPVAQSVEAVTHPPFAGVANR